MKRPLIGVMPLLDTKKESYWMQPGYMKGIETVGGIPVMLPLTSDEEILNQICETMDGFLFTGGQDISPELYEKKDVSLCEEISPERDSMEMKLFKLAYIKNKKIFGICRGIQFINAALGGDLYQDLKTEHTSDIIHRQGKPYSEPSHKVDIVTDSPLYRLLHTDFLNVNSCHHQAVKTPAPALKVMAVSEDGIIEALYDPHKTFLWAVQWHPEFSYTCDENSLKIFKAFIGACRTGC